MPISLAHGLLQFAGTTSEEVCGFVLRDWSFLQTNNVAVNPKREFFIDPTVQADLVNNRFNEILGIFHSHPGGSQYLSPADIAAFPPDPWRYWLVAGNRVIEWRRLSDGTIGESIRTPAIR